MGYTSEMDNYKGLYVRIGQSQTFCPNMLTDFPLPGKYKVLIRCITFNQSKYIEDSLRGFSKQKTNFPFLTYVIDDASTDGEQDVLRRWISEHCKAHDIAIYDTTLAVILMSVDKDNPNCFYAIHLLKKNLYQKKEKQTIHNYWREQCKYEALCEGDDYWTDSLKLQKQVDILEAHPDYTCCVHEYQELIQSHNYIKPHTIHYLKDYRGEGLALGLKDFAEFKFFTKTLTALYRIDSLDHSLYSTYNVKFDMTMFYALATQGSIYLMNQTMGVYRVHQASILNDGHFDKNTNYKMFEFATIENTKYSRRFVYRYLRRFAIPLFVYEPRNIIKSIKTIGIKYTSMVLFLDLPRIVIDIMKLHFGKQTL